MQIVYVCVFVHAWMPICIFTHTDVPPAHTPVCKLYLQLHVSDQLGCSAVLMCKNLPQNHSSTAGRLRDPCCVSLTCLWPGRAATGLPRLPVSVRFSATLWVESRPWITHKHLAPAAVSGRSQPRQVPGNPSSCGQGQKETWHLPKRGFQGRATAQVDSGVTTS